MQEKINNLVGVRQTNTIEYPEFPFGPDSEYPETKGAVGGLSKENRVYELMRNLFRDMDMDKDNYGKPNWNPMGQYVKPGGRVVLKPNWVKESNPVDRDISSLITHTAVIRFVIDYVLIALKGKGILSIVDAPIQGCNFEELLRRNQMRELISLYEQESCQVKYEIIDLRKTVIDDNTQKGRDGDPRGYVLVDLGKRSLLDDLSGNWKRFRVTMYDHKLMGKHHNLTKHEYLVSNTILSADTVINIPKMKCHIKAGVTGALKNLIGINGHKEYLPHHMTGSFFEGGDQYINKNLARNFYNRVYDSYWSEGVKIGGIRSWFLRQLVRVLALVSIILGRDSLLDGGWFGNETIPRTTIDLNNVLYYYNIKTKKLDKKLQRKVFNIIDGVIAGEGNGPLTPRRKKAGVVIMGENPVWTDAVMARMMGYDGLKVKTIQLAMKHNLSLFANNIDGLEIRYQGRKTEMFELPNMDFLKPVHWKQAEWRA